MTASKFNCGFLGKVEYAKANTGKLKEVHVCKNKKIEYIYCETAIRHGLCNGVFIS
jgi:hypothetical protein